MTITADTITDEQIRELRDEAWVQYAIACKALGIDPYGNGYVAFDERRDRRWRCAEILNARAAVSR